MKSTLIPRPRWNNERAQHYAALELPLDADGYLSQLNEQLKGVTATVDRRAPDNDVLKIDSEKGEFHLAAMKRKEVYFLHLPKMRTVAPILFAMKALGEQWNIIQSSGLCF